jgi:hypothetical protein
MRAVSRHYELSITGWVQPFGPATTTCATAAEQTEKPPLMRLSQFVQCVSRLPARSGLSRNLTRETGTGQEETFADSAAEPPVE